MKSINESLDFSASRSITAGTDACDAASEQGLEEVAPIRNVEAVQQWINRIEALGVQFDPQLHDAMSFETGESDDQIVVEELGPVTAGASQSSVPRWSRQRLALVVGR